MFNNTNVRFSNTAQVERTVKYLKQNTAVRRMQYSTAFKIKVIDLMLEERQAAANGKDTYINRKLNSNSKYFGKFSKSKFYEACGLGSTPITGEWEAVYDRVDGDANISHNVCAVSRVGLKELTISAESQGLGELARESSAIIRKTKELQLKHNAKEMGYKLVKVL